MINKKHFINQDLVNITRHYLIILVGITPLKCIKNCNPPENCFTLIFNTLTFVKVSVNLHRYLIKTY